MPFVFTLEPDAQITISMFVAPGEWITVTNFGYDSDCNISYSLHNSLCTIPGQPDDVLEQAFSVIEYDEETDSEYSFFDGVSTKRFLPDPMHRRAVVDALCATTRLLIDKAKPRIITGTTHTPNLPEKAREKFRRLLEVYDRCGYQAGVADSYHGRHIYMAERRT